MNSGDVPLIPSNTSRRWTEYEWSCVRWIALSTDVHAHTTLRVRSRGSLSMEVVVRTATKDHVQTGPHRVYEWIIRVY